MTDIAEKYQDLMMTVAMGQKFWRNNWCGSGPDRGASIWTVNKHGYRGDLIAHFGDQAGTHEAVCKIVQMHNAAMNALLFGSGQDHLEPPRLDGPAAAA